jgi:hypothetical protein
MVERRKKKRSKVEEHPLASKVKLRPSGPAIDRRAGRRGTAERTERERITLLLDADLIERLRNAVYWSDGVTLAGLVADSLTRTVDKMERARGTSFPRRKAELPTGRPRKGNE